MAYLTYYWSKMAQISRASMQISSSFDWSIFNGYINVAFQNCYDG